MLSKAKHCCRKMTAYLLEKKVKIVYSPRFREYGIVVSRHVKQDINFCPWCGRRLPKSLRNRYFDNLEALGFDVDVFSTDVPSQYKSDEWWRMGKSVSRKRTKAGA